MAHAIVCTTAGASGSGAHVGRPATPKEALVLERVKPALSVTRRGVLDFGRQSALIIAAALLYFGVRGQTEAATSLAVAHGFDLLAFEQTIRLDIEIGLQQLILPYQWAVTAVNWIYIWGHWPVIATTLIWLYRSRRLDFLVLRNALFLSGAIGLVIFAIYPVAPPRLLPMGFVDTVTELSTSYRVLQPPSLVNKYAALPSLHVGWNLLVGLAVFRAGTSWFVRGFGILSPLAMAAAVVLTGNHYVVDAALGALVALTGLALAFWLTPKLTVVRATRTRDLLGGTRTEQPVPVVVPRCSGRRS
jgi:hypothetical protein